MLKKEVKSLIMSSNVEKRDLTLENDVNCLKMNANSKK